MDDAKRGAAEVRPTELPLQEPSLQIVTSKRLLPGETMAEQRRRVARALAALEADPGAWEEKFHWALQYAFPAGRVAANAGAAHVKKAVSTINCTVSQTIEDSMDGIMRAAHDAALTLRAGCGIGYDFSTLRPKGAFVSGAGAYTSGPLPFMDIFDSVCKTVSSAGGRRGAQMGVLDVGHPDIEAFIGAKREAGRLRAFNLSLFVGDDFMDAVRADQDYALAYPAFPQDREEGCEIIYRWVSVKDERFEYNADGLCACKVYRVVRAAELFDTMMRSTYEYAEPGVLFRDRINDSNPLYFCEEIRSTNPCSEQPLPPNGSCLLGSVNLCAFVVDAFTPAARFDWDLYRKVVRLFARMLDNVVEINGLPLQAQRDEIFRKRRHGMGFMGLGSTMVMLGITYGSKASCEFTETVTRELAVENWRAALELAQEKGPAPIMQEVFEITPRMLAKSPKLGAAGYAVGDQVPGSVLHAYSEYMQRIASVDSELVEQLAKVGARFSHATSIAPTGTMAAGEGNNCSNGIEPTFEHSYIRNMIVPGENAKRDLEVMSLEMLAWRARQQQREAAGLVPESEPEAFAATAKKIPASEHLAVMGAAQRWIDSAISKTVNVAEDCPYEDFKDLYLQAFQLGLKGCATFRENPSMQTGVLVSKESLAATEYTFRLRDGSTRTVRGDQQVTYRGQTATASNLYAALKEGTYGRH